MMRHIFASSTTGTFNICAQEFVRQIENESMRNWKEVFILRGIWQWYWAIGVKLCRGLGSKIKLLIDPDLDLHWWMEGCYSGTKSGFQRRGIDFNTVQESIPVGCQPPTCQPNLLHDEQQVWTCPGVVPVQWGSSWTSLNVSISGVQEGGPCTEGARARGGGHETRLKTLPSRNFVGGW